MANEIYDSTWWGNTIQTASSIGTSTEMIQGQFNMLTDNQPNLVVNGDFATDSDWNKGNSWIIANGKATFDKNISGANDITQNNVMVVGNTYKLSFNTLETNGGNLAYNVGDGYVFINNISPNTNHTFFVTATSAILKLRGSSNFIGSTDNVSVKLVRAEEVEAVKCLADSIHRIGIQDIQN